MDNSVLIREIEYWEEKLKSADKEMIELAFFKIFIKFEKFISDIFILYCIGEKSIENYCPDRKLVFEDEKHLNAVINKNNNSYINHYDAVFKLSEHIFVNNPFEIISRDVNYCSDILNMKTIRDFIAHESNHSKANYSKRVLSGSSVFLKPSDFLIKNKKSTNKSYFTYYVNLMKKSSEYILKGPA